MIQELKPSIDTQDVTEVKKLWNRFQVGQLLGKTVETLPAGLIERLDDYQVGVEAIDGIDVLYWDGCEEIARDLYQLLEPERDDVGSKSDNQFLEQMFGCAFLEKVEGFTTHQLVDELTSLIQQKLGQDASTAAPATTDSEFTENTANSIPLFDYLWLHKPDFAKKIPECVAEKCKLSLLGHKALVVLFARFDQLPPRQRRLSRWLAVSHDIGKILDNQNGMHTKIGGKMVESILRRINHQCRQEGRLAFDDHFIQALVALTENHHLAGGVSQKVTASEGNLKSDYTSTRQVDGAIDKDGWQTMVSEARRWEEKVDRKLLGGEVDVDLLTAGDVYQSAQFEHMVETVRYASGEGSFPRQALPSSDTLSFPITQEAFFELCQYYGISVLAVAEVYNLINRINQLELLQILAYFSVADVAASDKPEVGTYLWRILTAFPQLIHLVLEILTHDEDDRWQEGLKIRLST